MRASRPTACPIAQLLRCGLDLLFCSATWFLFSPAKSRFAVVRAAINWSHSTVVVAVKALADSNFRPDGTRPTSHETAGSGFATQNTPVQLREVLDGDAVASVLDPDHDMLLCVAELAAVFQSTEFPGKSVDPLLQHDAQLYCHATFPCPKRSWPVLI